MQAGDSFAHYQTLSPIGAGAMGEVFRARDTRLDREVAVKVLPAELADDPERLARFRREAKTLAALNHRNIAAIHGLEEDRGRLYLVMELAQGETLEARIARGSMAPEEALKVAIQMASGLEEAHAKGVVHRDLKPANVKLGPEGEVKILDFGLARAYLGEEESAEDPGSMPTMTAAMTREGVILGTAAYMSPEQARGYPVDERTDIWAFGVVLFELLAGRRLFAGETATDILAMVLRNDPDWEALPPDLTPSLRRLMQRCLQKDKRQRLHHIADARIVMEEILRDGTSLHAATGDPGLTAPARTRSSRLGWMAAGAMALVAAALGWLAMSSEPTPPAAAMQFDMQMPADTYIYSGRLPLAFRPDGTGFVVSLKMDGGTQLFLRPLDGLELEAIPGTRDADSPFFSPDGRWLGFQRNGKLFKVALDGGTPTELCPTPWGGGTWTRDDQIVFTHSYSTGLYTVSAAGGEPRQLTTPDPSHNELGHWWPQVLPDDDWVVFTGYSTPIRNSRILAYSRKSGEIRLLIEGGSFGRWVPTGHLVFVREGKLLAAPFDRDGMAVTGPEQPVLDDVFLEMSDGFSPLDFSPDGTLVFVPASVMQQPRQLVWYDRQGRMTPLDLPPRLYSSPMLSPDGRRIAVTITESDNSDVWILDLVRGTSSRFTFSPTSDLRPIWTPDGSTVIYNGEEPQYTIYARPADGSQDTRLLLKEAEDTIPSAVSPDGKWLVYTRSQVQTDSDLWLYPLDEEGEPRLLLQTEFTEVEGAVSPDGRWLAYNSNESGRPQVYVMPFPRGGARIQVSIDGGQAPIWSPDGRWLYFLGGSEIMAASVGDGEAAESGLMIGRPELVFGGLDLSSEGYGSVPSLDPSGERFLLAHTPEESKPRTLRVVVNWFSKLQEIE